MAECNAVDTRHSQLKTTKPQPGLQMSKNNDNQRRLCPCANCKPLGSYQIRRTIYNYVKKYGRVSDQAQELVQEGQSSLQPHIPTIVGAGILNDVPQAGATSHKLPATDTDQFTTPDRDDYDQRSQTFDRHDDYVHTWSSNPEHSKPHLPPISHQFSPPLCFPHHSDGELGDADSDDTGESESVLSLLCPDDSCASDDEYSALCSDSGRSTGPMQDDSDSDVDGWDPENDPQFEHNENSFEDDESSGGPAGMLDGHTILPPAFSEH
ncbi:hypothetical protein PAXRUDRAFT_15587 [Paxillus rubicundulus Ve08.2h10]|uniref:Uncharacterized protein n=1 Tax=Paxillus rubicundulus Ve08.2h10 TaxID=930991 RepID=A0A0D0CDJ2_9AGAM|nr:hypothetical protein PAXRUDRAFT_15587 [Paxillus rubicundulus Ve08.2h10]